ncbi:hypothetical protein DRO41_02430 [Candidatus Bathyarchaeota archaeon]|nr:MAG: hypothetical protein DRO41_02430 [Candidatus Bathyarchaeota archaeon]
MQTIRPKVFKKYGKQRHGRGFSREELKKAGLSIKHALKLKIPVDPRRRTFHEENTKMLKNFLKSMEAPSKPKRKSKS